MEMDSRFGFHQPLHPPRTNLHIIGFPFDTNHPNSHPGFGNPQPVKDSTLKNVAPSPIPGFQHSRAREPNDLHNWFNCVPHFNHAFAPELNSAPKTFGQPISPTVGTVPAKKRFLVFDHSGDKTTLIYTAGVETPVQLGASWAVNLSAPTHIFRNRNAGDGIYPSSPTLADEKVEDTSQDLFEDEMHEDTEELDALLCSDSDFSEDDEETSTGHSPSTMTANYLHSLVEEAGEEVDSFAGLTKRQKLHGAQDTLSNSRTAIPSKTLTSSSLEYDAESSCGNGENQHKDELSSLSGEKRSRKDKIRETVSILQSIIPSAQGKIAIDVIDEAIRYLRFLKVKAKALGLDTL